jgi:hypothetical protein
LLVSQSHPAGTHRRSPGVSSCAFGAQPLDLRLWPLMDMDFVLSCALVRPQRLLSSFCSSARTWDTRFLQTSPHGDALALLSPSPPSGWQVGIELRRARRASTFPQAPLRSRTVGFPEYGSDPGFPLKVFLYRRKLKRWPAYAPLPSRLPSGSSTKADSSDSRR